jgi:hypothetical protein
MKNRFLISEEEKSRILGMHLNEQGNPLSNSTLNTTGNGLNITSKIPKIVSSATPEQKKLIDGVNSWIESNKNNIPKTADEITKFLDDQVTQKKLTPESLPYIKAAIQSQGKITFKPEEMGGQPTQQQPTQQPSSTFKMGVKNDKVTQIQTKLNEKFKAGLTPDGFWGPKTAAAVAKYLPQLKQPVTNTTTDDDTLV